MRPSVLHVTGWCRSGSTVLGNVLAETPGVFHAGELRFLWLNGVLREGSNHRCGCGADHDRCPVWSAVLDATTPAGTTTAAHAREVVRDQQRWRTRHTRRALRDTAPDGPWPRTLAAAYDAIAAATGAEVVVDSSKYASDAALTRRLGFDVRVVHLVRDPRAVAYSWLTPKDYTGQRGALDSTWFWLGYNSAGARVVADDPARALVLRYEDLVTRPRPSVAAALRLIGREAANPVDDAGAVHLGPNHTVTGNPNRFEQGVVRLRPDDRWRDRLGTGRRVAVTALAAPQLRRHGYGWRG